MKQNVQNCSLITTGHIIIMMEISPQVISNSVSLFIFLDERKYQFIIEHK